VLLHPDDYQGLASCVDTYREASADAQFCVFVDVHDLLPGTQFVEHTPLTEQGQVGLGATPTQDRQATQFVDLGAAGVGQDPAGGVLDAHQAPGEPDRKSVV